MHLLAVKKLVESVRRRERQGDCPTEPVLSVENLEDLVVTLADQLAARVLDNRMLRGELGLMHTCVPGGPQLYGDDGEMTCGKCRVDFMRDPVSDIVKRMVENGLIRAHSQSAVFDTTDTPEKKP